jgi:hypothetical protein
MRKEILIDGEATVEKDYRTSHPRLLAALAGLDLPFGNGFDFYELGGVERGVAKTAFQIMLNAATERKATLALISELARSGSPEPRSTANVVIQAFQLKYPKLARWFNSGIGLRLQNHDATICARVQRTLRNSGVPALSIHDSFIVASRYGHSLASIMDIEMDRQCQLLRNAAPV